MSQLLVSNVLFFGLPWIYSARAGIMLKSAQFDPSPETKRAALFLPTSGPSDMHVSWVAFLDSILNDWSKIKYYSLVIIAASFTVIQVVGGGGANNLITSSISLSLFCLVMSLVHAVILSVWLSRMKNASTTQICHWIPEVRNRETASLAVWNTWVLFSIPFAWMIWSVILLFASILILFRGSESAIVARLQEESIYLRAAVTLVSTLGMVCLSSVLITLRTRNG